MNEYDVLLIGGGIAGLSAAALFARAGYRVAVLEKEAYPRHKVCGEYISRESLPFLERLGLGELPKGLPQINRFRLTTGSGRSVEAALPLGGFGWSRYAFDAALAQAAADAGAAVFTHTKVTDLGQEGEAFEVKTNAGPFRGRLVAGSWGRKSNLDVQLQRGFLRREDPVLDGWVGIKRHIRYEGHPEDLIALHQFAGGYCGISHVEDGVLCLCYLVQGKALRAAGGSIEALEALVLSQNPFLKEIWRHAEFLYPKPLAVSGISFQRRPLVEKGILCLGDAGGMIPPLSGNGMSIAMHSAQIAFRHGEAFLKGKSSRAAFQNAFGREWNHHFRRRMAMGRFLQRRFDDEALLNPLITVLNVFPFLKSAVIRSTHGKVF